ncbi:hypothetical protein EJ110_NYTH22737 [Nymphaea thermarum]|nr:hypothetical protein EJ110_NYTH22737 [Nymphaea thermarum]
MEADPLVDKVSPLGQRTNNGKQQGRDSIPLPLPPAENELGTLGPSRQTWKGKVSPASSNEITMKDRETEAPVHLQSEAYSGLSNGGRKQRLPSAEGLGKEDHPTASMQSPLKSWAAMVGNSVQQELPKLGELEIREEDGRKFLFIPDEVYEEMAKPFRFAAIGTFYGGGSKANMEYSFVFKNLRHQWKDVRNPRFSVLGKGLYLIRVDSEVELQVVLRRNSWRIGAKTFVASRWRPGMEMKVDHTARVPIWIQIPNLASELWNQSVFDGIARSLGGEVVNIDPFTRSLVRLGYARLCIEVPLSFSPQPVIFLRRTSGDFIQVEIVYENMIRFCRQCGSITHLEANCTQTRVSVAQEPENTSEHRNLNGWTEVRMAKKATNWKRPGAAQEPANQALGSNRFKALQRNTEEGESLSSPQPVLEKPHDPEKRVGAQSEKPTLMEAWIVGEEQSIRGSTNKRRRPLCPPQLASANTKHMVSSNAIHGPKISAHKTRSRPLGRSAGSFKDGGSRNSLSSSAIKEHVEKPALHGNDPDPQMALASQAPPSWPIDPGDTSHKPTMEIDLGESGAGSEPVLPLGKEIAESSRADFNLTC